MRNVQASEKITLVEIAKFCGVSKSTVGYALNDKTTGKVSPEKLKLINSAVKKLGYIPNSSAKALKSQKTYTIGIMLPEPDNNFYGRLTLSLQRELARKGYTAIFSFWNELGDVDSIDKTFKALIFRGVDGIITCELPGVHFENSPVPVVFWQNPLPGFDSVSNYPDTEGAYRRIVDVLKSKGAKKFAVMSYDLSIGRSPLVLNVLKSEGVYPSPEHLIEETFSYKSAYEAMQRLIADSMIPDAVLANNDVIAIGAMSGALNAGIKIPQKVKFVGFDGIAEARYFYPSLTTFHIPVEEVCEKLLQLLFRRMENRNSPPLTLSVEPQLILGGSI